MLASCSPTEFGRELPAIIMPAETPTLFSFRVLTNVILPVKFAFFAGNAGVAQLVERNLAKVEVASSRLVSRSKDPFGTLFHAGDAGVAQLVERNLAKVEVASSRLVSRSIELPFELQSRANPSGACGSSSVGRAQPCQG